jgi:putative MATE family efflux protein
MWVMMLVNLVNIVLSWLLVTGAGPFPECGLPGIAAGTAASQVVGGTVVVLLLSRGRSGLGVTLASVWPALADVRRILRISLPAAGESLGNATCQLWFLGLINRLGVVATAAHGVAIRCEALAFLIGMAFAIAGGAIVGQKLGSRRADLAARAARSAWGQGVLVECAIGLVLVYFAGPMFAAFVGTDRGDVAALGVPVLRLVAFALPALATIQVLSGVLRGAGDTRWPLAIVLAGYLFVRMPLTYWLTGPAMGWGLYGAWVAMFVDLHVRAGLIMARFFQGGWKRVRV